jgi:hypothetical protein
MTEDGKEKPILPDPVIGDPIKDPNLPLDIRDLRNKEHFIIDDRFLNGYAKEVGVFGVAVYMSLCRHADKDQTCWPSIQKMAEELNLGRNSVINGLKNLKNDRIIGTIRIGRRCTNRYILYDRRHWRHRMAKESEVPIKDITISQGEVPNKDITSLPQGLHQSLLQTSSSKESQVRSHKKGSPADGTAEWNWPDYLKKMKEDPDRAIQIIALYLEYRGEKCINYDQIKGIIKRLVRIANDLKGFPDEHIRQTMVYLSHNREAEFLRNKWNMETIIKYILKVKVEAKGPTRDYSGKMFS